MVLKYMYIYIYHRTFSSTFRAFFFMSHNCEKHEKWMKIVFTHDITLYNVKEEEERES